ncbi:ATP-binding protein [Paucibacter sp. DJ2R-2]|uniref:ATP-binding protein n=1 Tax=Paucibacter sp. DJ2R-2 TaxID=2893558 RepID=UPI0021E47653|nr:ATP-binding protein [Paucibacter sp. DJ2R-2]MCV2422053.1 GAF domain-containing protein [Paucibacter sp. DJ4R-1]MCV2439330.1 GAF domain-containing protein [Paucibacter sp. DJ2R-2]
MLALAWQLRQRDVRRALQLAEQAERLFITVACAGSEWQRHQARLQLIRAEGAWLLGHLEQARQLLREALAEFERLQDPAGRGDAYWLSAFLSNDCGAPQQALQDMQCACEAYAASDDGQRRQMGLARSIYVQAYLDASAAQALLATCGLEEGLALDPAAAAWLHAGIALLAGLASQHRQATWHFQLACSSALQTGQIKQAVMAAASMSFAFLQLNNPALALEWSERGLEIARTAGLDVLTGSMLQRTGEALRHLGQPAAAQAHLLDALQALQPVKASRNYLIALIELGDIALALAEPAQALDWFRQAEAMCRAMSAQDRLIDVLRGLALVKKQLGSPDQALAHAQEALSLCHAWGYRIEQIELLQVVAGLQGQLDLAIPVSEQNHAPSPALHYLQQALGLAAQLEGYVVPHALLEDAASECARLGQLEQAYQLALQAGLSRERIQSREAGNRAMAVQIRHEMERARLEAEHLKQLAQAQAERALAEAHRADALLGANATLEDLGKIGREITASLDAEAVFNALARHVQGLLDAASFSIYLLDEQGCFLHSALREECGQRLSPHRIALDDPESNLVRCVREGLEIVRSLAAGTSSPMLIPGSLPTLSMMFAPLTVGERCLGAMTIQSVREQAYGERETAIFRTLCAYGAIALANAEAIQALKRTQVLLVQQEKLASLGAMVAGLSHELNTPIGNALMASTTLESRFDQIAQTLTEGQLRRSALDSFVADGLHSSALVTRSMKRAAGLIADFKQLVVDQASEERREFDLRSLVEDCVAALRVPAELSGLRVHIEVPQALRCDSYPGPLGWALGNVLQNCLTHAFKGRASGRIAIELEVHGDVLHLEVADDGSGMSPQVLAHVFDPFFTTQLGSGGSGLGLSVAYRIVTTVLGGDLQAKSSPGQGSRFILSFPRSAMFRI